MFIRAMLVVAAVVMTAATAVAQTQTHMHGMSDTDAIRHLIKSTWDKPADAVIVPYVVVASDYAVAGWTQGEMGGRALLRKKASEWSIALCAGDQLRDAETLRKAGMADAEAERLAAALAQSERALSSKEVAMFSRFEGLVSMDQQTGHAHGR